MIIDCYVQVDDEEFRFCVPQKDFEEKMPPVIAISKENGKIVLIGESLDMLEERIPDWKQHGDLEFIYPFQNKKFDPKFSFSMLRFHSIKANNSSFLGYLPMFIFPLAWVRYELEIYGYEDVPLEVQKEFVKAFKKTRYPFTLSLTINGERIRIRPFFY